MDTEDKVTEPRIAIEAEPAECAQLRALAEWVRASGNSVQAVRLADGTLAVLTVDP